VSEQIGASHGAPVEPVDDEARSVEDLTQELFSGTIEASSKNKGIIKNELINDPLAITDSPCIVPAELDAAQRATKLALYSAAAAQEQTEAALQELIRLRGELRITEHDLEQERLLHGRQQESWNTEITKERELSLEFKEETLRLREELHRANEGAAARAHTADAEIQRLNAEIQQLNSEIGHIIGRADQAEARLRTMDRQLIQQQIQESAGVVQYELAKYHTDAMLGVIKAPVNNNANMNMNMNMNMNSYPGVTNYAALRSPQCEDLHTSYLLQHNPSNSVYGIQQHQQQQQQRLQQQHYSPLQPPSIPSTPMRSLPMSPNMIAPTNYQSPHGQHPILMKSAHSPHGSLDRSIDIDSSMIDDSLSLSPGLVRLPLPAGVLPGDIKITVTARTPDTDGGTSSGQ